MVSLGKIQDRLWNCCFRIQMSLSRLDDGSSGQTTEIGAIEIGRFPRLGDWAWMLQ